MSAGRLKCIFVFFFWNMRIGKRGDTACILVRRRWKVIDSICVPATSLLIDVDFLFCFGNKAQ